MLRLQNLEKLQRRGAGPHQVPLLGGSCSETTSKIDSFQHSLPRWGWLRTKEPPTDSLEPLGPRGSKNGGPGALVQLDQPLSGSQSSPCSPGSEGWLGAGEIKIPRTSVIRQEADDWQGQGADYAWKAAGICMDLCCRLVKRRLPVRVLQQGVRPVPEQ